jgi:hypothetical protein
MLATAALVAAAAAIGGSRTVRTDDREHPSALWGAIVAGSGAGKSPALDAGLKPYREAAEIRDIERSSAWARVGEWEKNRSADKGSRPSVPGALRVTDATTEALATVLQGAPRGVLLDVDELSGWATGLDAYRPSGRGPDRARYCALWSRQALAIERKGAAPVIVSKPVVSLIGGIQPGVLTALNSQPDGLAQRLLYTVHTDHQEPYPTRVKPEQLVLNMWRATVTRLLLIESISVPLQMTDAALNAWHDGRDRRVDAQREHGHAALYAKFDSMSARLALVLTLAGNSFAGVVDAAAVEAAWTICLDYYAPHGRTALAGTDVAPADGQVAGFLTWLGKRGSEATLRDITTSGPSYMRTNDGALAVIGRARDAVQETTTKPLTGGRAVRRFAIAA